MTRLLAVISLLLCVLGQAHAGSVHIILSEETASYQQAAKDIQSQLRTRGYDEAPTVSSVEAPAQQPPEAGDLIVNIGQAATVHSSRSYPNNSQIYSYIDKSALPAKLADKWAAVLLDQPVQRLFDTAASIVEGRYRNKLIIAVSEDNQRIREEIASLDLARSVELEVLVIDNDTEPAKIIDKALFNAGALIAVRDKRIWSGENAKWMLYQSYKYNVPVIGYSKSFLKAGALVSVYASLTETARTTAQLITEWHTQQGQLALQGLFYPRYTVAFNQNIARALKITIPDTITEGEKADVRD